MAPQIISTLLLFFLFRLPLTGHATEMPNCEPPSPPLIKEPIFPQDVDLLQFAENIEHTECEWFLFGAFGYGLDTVEPDLAMGGPPPIGAKKADLDDVTWRVIAEFGYQELLAGLLAVESEQDGIIRGYLFQRLEELVPPYNITVAEFTDRISDLRNRLAMCGIKDEGLLVPIALGAEQKITTNVVSADQNSLGYSRTPREILRVMYGTGDEHVPGGFFPEGGNGVIARELLGKY